MKILNIDSFAEVERSIVLGGVSYPIEELSVQNFINNMKAAEDLEEAGTVVTVSAAYEQAVKSIKQSIPSLDEAVVKSMKVPTMAKVLQFIRGELDESATVAESGDAEKKPS